MRIFYNPAGGFQSVGYAADGRVLTLDNRARLTAWDVAAGRPDRVGAVPPDVPRRWARLRGCGSADGTAAVLTTAGLHRFDLAARGELPRFKPPDGHVADASEDGTVAVVCEPGALRWRLWDVHPVAPRPEQYELAGGGPGGFRYHPALAPDDRTFAVSSATDGRLLVWAGDTPVPRVLARTRVRRHYAYLVFAPDARFLVAAPDARHGPVTVWDLPAGTVRWSARQELYVWAVAVHPSGGLVAVATAGDPDGRVVRFLDAATGAEMDRFHWHAGGKVGRVRCLAFSPDGLTCAAGGSDRRLVVWDVDL